MSAPGIPNGFNVQSGNQQILASWNISPGADSYILQRSQDNVTYTTLTTITGSPLATSYLDTSPALGTQYWYKVAAQTSGSPSSYTNPQSAVAVPVGEKCLSQIRLEAMQRADRVNSNFVTLPEWTNYINQAMFELYDLLITVFEDYYVATPVQFPIDGTTFLYPLPNGSNTFLNGVNPNTTFTPPALYKLLGVDLALQSANNAYVTINKFNFIDRNRFVYPNTASTIYGVFNLQYRIMGSNIEFIPTPTAGQSIRLWYIPRLTQLLQDTDTTTTGISGWIEYVIVRAAKYALDKEESDSSKLDAELLFLKGRIEESAANRDAGQPDKISDTRSGNGNGWGNGWGGGWNGGVAGWAVALLPNPLAQNSANKLLANSILLSEFSLRNIIFFCIVAYFFYFSSRKFSGSIRFAKMFNLLRQSLTFFTNHIMNIIGLGACEQVIRINTVGVIASMQNVKTLRNRLFKKLVSYSSSSIILSSYRKSRAALLRGVSMVTTTRPFPARTSKNDLFHKPSFDIHKTSVAQESHA